MAEGTPLDALETGDIRDEADSAKMAEILRDMNASGGIAQQPPHFQQQQQQPMPPMMMHQQPLPTHPQHNPNYIPMENEVVYKPRRKNIWSSITEKIRDPILVTVLIFVLSLPIFHTQLAKYAGWAFAVGGQLSWLGLLMISAIGGLLFGVFQNTADLLGM